MTITKKLNYRKQKKQSSIFEKIMAFWATVNLILVIFDISYIPLRDFWLQGRIQLFIKLGKYELELPKYPVKIIPFRVTNWYDWVKGIEPFRETQEYLERVEDLNEKISQIALSSSNNPEKSGTFTPETETVEAILADLRQKSIAMIETNPFQIADKTGTLERIKNKMRVHIFETEDASSTESFNIFWSKEHLIKAGIREELNFFEREIKPLIETNYYRPIGENGQLVDNFGIIDFSFFTIYFAIEFLARTWYISRRHTGVSWLDAMLWRWYDFFFFFPVLRWLRIIPVTIRLNKIGVIDLSAIQKQASQGFVAGIAEDLTEVVVIRIINQVQSSVQEGEIEKFLSNQSAQEYIDLNDTNEITEILKLILELIVNQVIPQIRPEVEEILKYSLNKSLNQSEAFQTLQKLPGINNLQHNLTEKIVQQLYQVFSETLQASLQKDREFEGLLENVTSKFTNTISSQIQAKASMNKIESLVIALLEEVKINYVQKLSTEDVEDILEQKRALQSQAQTTDILKS